MLKQALFVFWVWSTHAQTSIVRVLSLKHACSNKQDNHISSRTQWVSDRSEMRRGMPVTPSITVTRARLPASPPVVCACLEGGTQKRRGKLCWTSHFDVRERENSNLCCRCLRHCPWRRASRQLWWGTQTACHLPRPCILWRYRSPACSVSLVNVLTIYTFLISSTAVQRVLCATNQPNWWNAQCHRWWETVRCSISSHVAHWHCLFFFQYEKSWRVKL